MKKIFLFLFSIISVTVNAQIEKQIETIDSIRKVMKDKTNEYTFHLSRKHNSIYECGDLIEGEELKIVIIHQNEHLENTSLYNLDKRLNWYFHNGEVVYFEISWLDNEKNKMVIVQQAYFNKGHLIGLINGGKKINISSKLFLELRPSL